MASVCSVLMTSFWGDGFSWQSHVQQELVFSSLFSGGVAPNVSTD